ncbi:glycosyltransferase [candidate division KSB1 bacterium]|nr:glycosyltransferase [candidate division KSB1 bacterium]
MIKILLVTKYFPPLNTVASHRTYAFAKYLCEYGIVTDVITPQYEGSLNQDTSKLCIYYTHKEIKAVNSFVGPQNRVKNWFKKTGIRSFIYYIKSSFFYAGRRTIQRIENKYNAVMVSFGPEEVLRLGKYIHKKFNIPLIIDYRDLWLDNHFKDWTWLDRKIIYWLEKRILQHASLVITVSENLANQIFRRYGVSAEIIYNGFLGKQKPLKNHNHHICYCGSLYGGLRPISYIFPALKQNPHFHMTVYVFDRLDADLILNLAKSYNVENRVNIGINKTYQDSTELMENSSILLFLNRTDGKAKGVLSGKLFEYMRTGNFILGIGHPNDEARQIIEKYRLGAYASTHNQVSEILSQFHTWKPEKRQQIEFFSRKNQTKHLARLIHSSLEQERYKA